MGSADHPQLILYPLVLTFVRKNYQDIEEDKMVSL